MSIANLFKNAEVDSVVYKGLTYYDAENIVEDICKSTNPKKFVLKIKDKISIKKKYYLTPYTAIKIINNAKSKNAIKFASKIKKIELEKEEKNILK